MNKDKDSYKNESISGIFIIDILIGVFGWFLFIVGKRAKNKKYNHIELPEEEDK